MKHCTPNAHITDSRFYSGGYTTQEARRIFCDLYRYQRWLDVETTLALSQAELGIIPEWAAGELERKAHIGGLDLEAIQKGVRESSHSLLPLLRAWESVCDGTAGQFIHFGATTQDIQDTAQVLEMADVLNIVERDLRKIAAQLSGLTRHYKALVTIGRTHTQHALPMTMGLKMAVWLDELWRNHERLLACRDRILVSQLFGGVGTLDAFGPKAMELLTIFSQKLELNTPLTAWHVSRDRGAEFLSTMAMISGTFAKIADEIRCLARSETGEFEEPFQMGKVGSSTMPHKRNPELCEQVVVLAKLIKANAGLGFDGIINEHERDYRAVRLEWVTLTDTSLYICGLLSIMKTILGGLIVHEGRVTQNLDSAATFISTEALMFHLGEVIGKQRAHQIIYEASMKAVEGGLPLVDLLMSNNEISAHFTREDIEKTIDPANHIGMSRELTQRVIDYVSEELDKLAPIDDTERQCSLSGADGSCSLDM